MNTAIRFRPIAVIACLLVASLLSARALADGWRSLAREALSTSAELGGAVMGSAATYAAGAGLVYLGTPPVGYCVVALAPAGAAGGTSLVGGWLDHRGNYWWSALGAYAGTGVGLLVGAELVQLPHPGGLGENVLRVVIPMYVGANVGAVLGYKLSRRPPEPDESRLRLDPPSLALSLVWGHDPEFREFGSCPQPRRRPEIAGVKLNLLSVRF